MPITPIVTQEKTARAIAEAIIAEHQKPERTAEYVLKVNLDSHDESKWVAYQCLKSEEGEEDWMKMSLGGGGLSMCIDVATGAITDLVYQR